MRDKNKIRRKIFKMKNICPTKITGYMVYKSRPVLTCSSTTIQAHDKNTLTPSLTHIFAPPKIYCYTMLSITRCKLSKKFVCLKDFKMTTAKSIIVNQENPPHLKLGRRSISGRMHTWEIETKTTTAITMKN